jgi:putative transposon-encoded protein
MDESYEEMDEADMDIDSIINSVFGSKDSEESYSEEEENEETVYEIEMDEMDEMMDDEEDIQMESTKPKIGSGAKIGKPKFSYKKTSGGFKEDMKQGTRGVGMGKPKFEFKEGMKKEKMDDSKLMKKGKPSSMFYSGKKEETKEASRTYAFGSKDGSRGLRKGITPNRNLTFENEQKYEEQIKVLREKNEEYRKALNVFRDKLNEVATFNSNLAYATRLFTEHSTSKQEKINILRRFDDVETIKESKNLYRTIKSELTTTNKTSIAESIEVRIEKTPSSGSASTLIESKTYENPQFLRMKDIMSKIIK